MPLKGPGWVDEGPVLRRSVGYCAPALQLVPVGTDQSTKCCVEQSECASWVLEAHCVPALLMIMCLKQQIVMFWSRLGQQEYRVLFMSAQSTMWNLRQPETLKSCSGINWCTMYKEIRYLSAIIFRCSVHCGVFLAMFNFSMRHVCEGKNLFGEMSIQAFHSHDLQNVSSFTECTADVFSPAF